MHNLERSLGVARFVLYVPAIAASVCVVHPFECIHLRVECLADRLICNIIHGICVNCESLWFDLDRVRSFVLVWVFVLDVVFIYFEYTFNITESEQSNTFNNHSSISMMKAIETIDRICRC